MAIYRGEWVCGSAHCAEPPRRATVRRGRFWMNDGSDGDWFYVCTECDERMKAQLVRRALDIAGVKPS